MRGLAIVVFCGALLSAASARADAPAHLSLAAPRLHLEHTRPALLDRGLDLRKLSLDSEVSWPLDTGGGARGATGDPATRQVICFILGFFPGFGIGHLLAGSRDGFVLFLIVDVAILTAAILLSALAPTPFYALAWVAWIIEHVFEGYDAYVTAGGEHLVQRSVDALMYAGRADDAAPRLQPAIRAMSFAF
jgi:hypothetical protein